MLGTFLFLGFWVVLGLTLFIVAVTGGPSQVRERVFQSQSRRGRRATTVVVTLVFLGLGVAIPALVIAGNEDQDKVGSSRIKLNAAQERGRKLFGTTCNQCHTLTAANTVGKVGPNLDNLKPPRALVLNAIEQGRARGVGRMPADLLQGRDASDVAAFVAAVAGKE